MPFSEHNQGLVDKLLPIRVAHFQMLLAGAIIFLSGAINLLFFPLQGSWSVIIHNPGVYIDALTLSFLLFTLWLTSRLNIPFLVTSWIKRGLYLWLIGATFDFMDEIIRQPRWVGYFVEDLTRLSGMFLVALGLYITIKKIDCMYTDVRVQSLQDELTLLPNRRFFVNALKSKEDKTIALLLIDIDFFKKINDTHGHMVGDAVLHDLGKLLAGMHQEHFLATRIGGEEFAVILDEISKPQVEYIAQTILNKAREIRVNNDMPLSVSIGVGIRESRDPQDTFFSKVDQALYRAKTNGRGRVEWVSDSSGPGRYGDIDSV